MADKKPKPRGLGRGLSALMADVNAEPVSTDGVRTPRNAEILVPIEKVDRRATGHLVPADLGAAVPDHFAEATTILRTLPKHPDARAKIIRTIGADGIDDLGSVEYLDPFDWRSRLQRDRKCHFTFGEMHDIAHQSLIRGPPLSILE